jgi:hypothetical protein
MPFRGLTAPYWETTLPIGEFGTLSATSPEDPMKDRTFRISTPLVFASLLILVLTIAVSQPASAQASCPAQTTTSIAAPTNLRVDIADGTTGKLFVSWNPPTTGTWYYTVCRSTSPSSGYTIVSYCSQGAYAKSTTTPQYEIDEPGISGTLACRDDGGVLAYPANSSLTPGTTYYYKVQACNGTGSIADPTGILCGYFTSQSAVNQNYNTPILCSGCTALPSLQGSLNTNKTLVTISSPPTNTIETSTVTPMAMFKPTANEYYAYHNTSAGTTQQNVPTLVVDLPGSGALCSGGYLMWAARNLGFDTICVNYDNASEQENICAAANFSDAPLNLSGNNLQTAVAECFTAISQAKLNYQAATFTGTPSTIDCTKQGGSIPRCGYDKTTNANEGKTLGPYYYVATEYDSIEYRITTLLYYLCNTTANTGGGYPAGSGNYDTVDTRWENYLVGFAQGATCQSTATSANLSPNWPSIILGGWSQGGGMATFADYYYATLPNNAAYVDRVINLSAPLQASIVLNVTNMMTPATYFSLVPTTILPNIYGLVSANDYNSGTDGLIHYAPLPSSNSPGAPPYNSPPYPVSVLQTVWDTMGFDATNHEAEVDLNCDVTSNAMYPNYCASIANPLPYLGQTSSHNFVNWAIANDYTDNPPTNGHADTLYMWNEDIYEYMLLNAN